MNHDIITVTGLCAAFCSTFAMLPQALRIWRTGQVEQLSGGTFSLMFGGATLWLVYGIMKSDFIIIAANITGLIFIVYISVMKLRSILKK
jgi:MtN3 and saliva related transmembrane protein